MFGPSSAQLRSHKGEDEKADRHRVLDASYFMRSKMDSEWVGESVLLFQKPSPEDLEVRAHLAVCPIGSSLNSGGKQGRSVGFGDPALSRPSHQTPGPRPQAPPPFSPRGCELWRNRSLTTSEGDEYYASARRNELSPGAMAYM